MQAGRQQRKMIAMEYKVMENKAFDIKSMTLPEVRQVVEAMGEKPFRAKQLYEWMHVKLARSYDEMTNLPKTCKNSSGSSIHIYR